MKNLNDYANTIGTVFEILADSMTFFEPDAIQRLHRLVDADTCAEIIEAAKEQQAE